MRIIKWLLRTSFYGFFLLPLISWLVVYGFITLTMITMGTTDIWSTDPKDTPLGETAYDIALSFPIWGILLSVPLLIYIVADFIVKRMKNTVNEGHLLPVWVRIGCFTGSLLCIMFFMLNFIHLYQFWFFD